MELFDLNEAIDEVLVMVRDAIDKNRVSVRTCLMERVATVRGDRVQLQQVVLNLILNAVDAMSSAEEGARELTISTEPSRTEGILVAVRDSGPGINPEQLDRISTPSTQQRRVGSEWGFRFVDPSSMPMAGGCGQRPINLEGPFFSSLCRPAWKTHESSSHGLPD